MTRINIDLGGFVQVDKDDMVINDTQSENFDKVDTKKLTTEELLEGLKSGRYLFDFYKTYMSILDGEETYEFSEDLE
jgi:hypothetical protein